jgi:hypothetical protein
MHSPFLVSCAGQYRSGKDTLTSYLINKLNEHKKLGEWKHGSFGLFVKKIFSEHFNVSLDFIEEWKVKINEIPPGFDQPLRDGLTMIGDGWRKQKKTIWIDKLLTDNKDNLVIADNRYINEAETILSKGGITILVWRPGFENNKQSASEQELMPFVRSLKEVPSGPIDIEDIPFSLWFKNEGSLQDLYSVADNVFIPYIIKKINKWMQ